MWVYRTGEYEKRQIVLFEYQPDRPGTHAKNYLKGFSGYFVADGYAGYNSVDGAIRCGCWSHVRRKFLEAMPGKRQTVGTKAMEGITATGSSLWNVSLRILGRKNGTRPVLKEASRSLKHSGSGRYPFGPLPYSALGKAVGYATGQKTTLNNSLLDGRIPISNNLDENAIRPFVVGRKTGCSATTPVAQRLVRLFTA